MRRGFSERHGSHAGKSARGIAARAFRLRGASACSDGGRRTKPGPSLHVRGTVLGRSQRSWRRAAVTQCRPWPAEAVWSEARAAPARCAGAGKRAERFLAASPVPVIRDVLTSKGASVRLADVASRIPTRRDVERSESTSGDRFPARGSRPRPGKAGTASAARESFE
jgi:hypothetical protein